MLQTIPATLLFAYTDNTDVLAADAPTRVLAQGVARIRGIVAGGRTNRARTQRSNARLIGRPAHAA